MTTLFPSAAIGDAASLRDVGTLHSQLKPLSECVELLTGQRGQGRAVMTNNIVLTPQNWTVLKQVRTPSGFVTSAAGGVPTYNDYIATLNDMQQLIADVATIQAVLQDLIRNLRN